MGKEAQAAVLERGAVRERYEATMRVGLRLNVVVRSGGRVYLHRDFEAVLKLDPGFEHLIQAEQVLKANPTKGNRSVEILASLLKYSEERDATAADLVAVMSLVIGFLKAVEASG